MKNENDTETSDEMIKLKVRTFIGLLISVITVTNSFTLIYNMVHENAELREYNKKRADRVAERKKQEAIDYYKMETLKTELKLCKETKKN